MAKKVLSFILSVCLLFFCGCSSFTGKLSGEEIYDKIAPSTVEITAEGSDFSSLGSGFYIDESGTVVTNYHVIEGCLSAFVTTHDGGIYPVTAVVGFDKGLDIALLATTKQSSKPVAVSSKGVATGEVVYALGSSLGLTGTFSEGLVSAAERVIDGISYIQISAPISSGNSGGPLVNDRGEVVGITSAGFEDGQNLNLAIPIKVLQEISTDTPLPLDEFYDSITDHSLIPSSVGITMANFTNLASAKAVYDEHIYSRSGSFIFDVWYAGGEYQSYTVEPGALPRKIDDWCFDSVRQVGDREIFETIDGYTVCYIDSLIY